MMGHDGSKYWPVRVGTSFNRDGTFLLNEWLCGGRRPHFSARKARESSSARRFDASPPINLLLNLQLRPQQQQQHSCRCVLLCLLAIIAPTEASFCIVNSPITTSGNMTFFTLAARRATVAPFGKLGATATKTTNPCFAAFASRYYTGPPIKVAHYNEGWTADGVDDSVKGIEKYCTQTFNKISQVVSSSRRAMTSRLLAI